MNQNDRDLILSNKNQLARLLKLDEVAPLAVVKGIFPQKMMDDILGDYENDYDRKVRLLIDLTHRGPKAFTKFIELLKETGHEEAAAILENRLDNAQIITESANASPTQIKLASDNGNEIETKMSSHRMQVRDGQTLFCGDDIYHMQSIPRGFCILINNVSFENGAQQERKGSNVDARRLDEIFQELSFEVHYKIDLTSEEIKELLKKVSEKEDLKNHDAIVVIILSHGTKGCVYGTDNIGVRLDEIYSYFNNENCRYLIGKPKMFFIQACRGREYPFSDASFSLPGEESLSVSFDLPIKRRLPSLVIIILTQPNMITGLTLMRSQMLPFQGT